RDAPTPLPWCRRGFQYWSRRSSCARQTQHQAIIQATNRRLLRSSTLVVWGHPRRERSSPSSTLHWPSRPEPQTDFSPCRLAYCRAQRLTTGIGPHRERPLVPKPLEHHTAHLVGTTTRLAHDDSRCCASTTT